MSGIVCIIRDPFVERVPGLRSLLVYLGEHGFELDIICPIDPKQPQPSFLSDRIRVHPCAAMTVVGGRAFRVPTALRMFADGLLLSRRIRPRYVLGTGQMGIPVASALGRMLSARTVAYTIEYPASRHGLRLSPQERLEHVGLRSADLVVTHDAMHADFISRAVGIARSRFEVVPNAWLGPAGRRASDFFRKRLPLSDLDVVLLHSGGVGVWFDSLGLAQASHSWPGHLRLVFHTSSRLDGSPYLSAVRDASDGDAVMFSTEPVAADEMDNVISAAHIGLAFYSVDVLGFRAKLMGLASGKIGSYLKCGIPVIASDIPSIKSYLEQYQCGVCIRHFSEIPEAVERILTNYGRYSAGALRCFEDLWAPERYCHRIASRLSELV